jgi:hypothetical protein
LTCVGFAIPFGFARTPFETPFSTLLRSLIEAEDAPIDFHCTAEKKASWLKYYSGRDSGLCRGKASPMSFSIPLGLSGQAIALPLASLNKLTIRQLAGCRDLRPPLWYFWKGFQV